VLYDRWVLLKKKGQVPCKIVFAENIIDLVMSIVICHYLIYPTADLMETRLLYSLSGPIHRRLRRALAPRFNTIYC
jgi:hypothetical protein